MHKLIWAVALTFILLPLGFAVEPNALGQARAKLMMKQQSLIVGTLQHVGAHKRLEIDASPDSDIKVTDPLVDIGSITKFVTAVATLKMVEQRHFALDTPLGALIEDIAPDKAEITIHQLLTHTAGVIESTGSDEEQLSRDEMLARVMEAPLLHLPGARYHYSNAGYSVLAALIEIKSGLSYEQYVANQLIAPNGLEPIGYARVYKDNLSALSNRQFATAFQRANIRQASWGGGAPGWNLIGNGGAVTTAEGFLRFWRAFYDGRLVAPELVRQALTPHVAEGDGDSYYGYGLVVERSPTSGTIYWHDGGNDVFSAEWRHLRDDDTTIFIAAPQDKAFAAMDVFLKDIAHKQ